MIKDHFIVSTKKKKVSDGFPKPDWEESKAGLSLYLGDALEILKEFPDNSVDCVWTDPPYNLSNDGITCVAGRMVPVNKGDWDRSRGIEGDYEFNLTWTKECYRILRPTGTIWVTGTLHIHPSVGMALLRNEFRLLNDIVWVKPNPPPNLGRRTFTHSSELIYWASKAAKGSKHRHKFNYEEMKSDNDGKQMKSIWTFNAASAREKQHGKHPTQKPVELIDRCLRAATDHGDIVLDPFAGSGSTGVAATNIGRRFIGIEKEKDFFTIAKTRLSTPPPPPPPRIREANQKTRVVWQRSVTRIRRTVVEWSENTQFPYFESSSVTIYVSSRTILESQYSSQTEI